MNNGIRRLSAVAGRQRWEVSALCDRGDLVAPLEAALLGLAGISSCQANPLTGRVLIHTRAALPLDEVQAALESVLTPPPSQKAPKKKARRGTLVGGIL